MKILSWNVNGIRALYKKGFLDWFMSEKADIVCIQETKAGLSQFPDDIKRIKTALESGEWNSAISFKPMKEPRERAYTVKNGVFYPLKYTNF